MSRVKLGDVAFERKETLKNNKGYPTVGLEHIIPEEIELTNWDEGAENTFTKVFHVGDVLFGRRRAYLKKAAVAPIDGICSGDITVISAIEDKISPRLLPFIIQNDKFFDFAVEKSAGSLSPRVKWQHAKEFEFELPEMEQQEKLAELLWAMNDTKTAYKKLQKQTDELVKSQFIEMSSSAKKRVKLTECADILYGFPFNSKLFNSDGVGTPLIRIRDINSGFSDTFTSENADEKYMVKRGDCVLGMDGNFDIVKWNNVEGYLNQRCCKVIPRTVTKEYLLYYLMIRLKEIESSVTSTTVKHLSATHMNSIEVPWIDREGQDHFAELYMQSDKSKFELEQSIAELTATYKRIIMDNIG